jgi:hypothetical protein
MKNEEWRTGDRGIPYSPLWLSHCLSTGPMLFDPHGHLRRRPLLTLPEPIADPDFKPIWLVKSGGIGYAWSCIKRWFSDIK